MRVGDRLALGGLADEALAALWRRRRPRAWCGHLPSFRAPTGSPPSMTAMQELVVPRSIPRILLMVSVCLVLLGEATPTLIRSSVGRSEWFPDLYARVVPWRDRDYLPFEYQHLTSISQFSPMPARSTNCAIMSPSGVTHRPDWRDPQDCLGSMARRPINRGSNQSRASAPSLRSVDYVFGGLRSD